MSGRILIFARTPELGKVKTRLQPVLGEEGCYQLHSQLVSSVVRTAVQSEVAPVDVWHTGNAEHVLWRSLVSEFPISLNEQNGDELGERMLNAASTALMHPEPSDWLILIGSDCPEIDRSYLLKAMQILDSGTELVIGPALDGGYVLLGFRRINAFLFHDIPWGTGQVLVRTLAIAEQNACPVQLLKPLRDIDTADDLPFYDGEILSTNSVFTPPNN